MYILHNHSLLLFLAFHFLDGYLRTMTKLLFILLKFKIYSICSPELQKAAPGEGSRIQR